MNSIHLYTTYYHENNQDRKNELEYCIEENLNNESIDSITILNQDGDLSKFKSNKLVVLDVESRPTFKNFIDCINKKYKNENEINIIANTDIFFDINLRVITYIDLTNKCFALSRWEKVEYGYKLYNRKDSQDVWIFKGKIPSSLNCDYPVGVARCDNRFLYDLTNTGYIVKNPSFSIKAYHMHKNHMEREYKEEDNYYKIKGPYIYIRPHNLLNLINTVLFNMMHSLKLGTYVFDRRKISISNLLMRIKKISRIK